MKDYGNNPCLFIFYFLIDEKDTTHKLTLQIFTKKKVFCYFKKPSFISDFIIILS